MYQFGNNAYGKPCTALNILRETIMGRELFDYAFKEYARRWAFKHPTPDDFFRTMEDASGVDLDWFWRGWFYGTDHCDMAMEQVKVFQIDTKNPEIEKAIDRAKEESQPADISLKRDGEEKLETQLDRDPKLADFYTTYDPYKVTSLDIKDYEKYLSGLSDEEKAILNKNQFYYEVTVANVGGLIMPLIFEFEFADGTKREIRIPAEIWKMSEPKVTKLFSVEKEVKSITLDPYLETADVELNNNSWPPKVVPSRFELFKQNQNWSQPNPMQRARSSQE
jgi:hypothetical protein